MSRSRRKTPITGITKAESDKRFKEAEHKRERRRLKAADLTEETPPDPKAFGNPWASDKDGKHRIDPDKFPDFMRK
ncbi:hypothetical protein [Actibacterium sp. 188UL27-1]|uniref:hypothetical protein n=1 Tax=Actibacterium sp. 188UL27-1 TaxID=2786961 RepID=UPI00195A99DB|nr:hypothetical protein [Actibacterium sp. 188UL27-1]MBM7069705.1 hypothetical protein [Actibacterium sp. 188UL27-1]